MEIKVRPEGRENIWIPEKQSLKSYIKNKKEKEFHNFIQSDNLPMAVGANVDINILLEDINKAKRLAIFTDKTLNFGHSLALVINNELKMYDIGEIKKDTLEVNNE